MHSSPLSNSDSNHKHTRIIIAVTWICRIATGLVFIISGFVKAIDPWGTIYKFGEYALAFGVTPVHSLLVAGAFALFAFEFLIGIFLLSGCYKKASPVLAVAFMCVMLPLTLWLAIRNPIKDCGCFGDFLTLSNWETFGKNVILTLMSIWLLKFNHRTKSVISPAFQWIAFVLSLIFILLIGIRGYIVQPMLDFRPYPAGTSIIGDEERADDAGESYTFVYEKDGVSKEFSIDDELPSEEEGWKFVERKVSTQSSADRSEDGSDIKTLRIWDRDGVNDLSEEIIDNDGKEMLLLIPDIREVSPSTTWKINEISDWAQSNGIDMSAVVAGNSDEIDEWENLSMPQYDIYTADDTAIKEVARGNPSIVYVENGTIRWKLALGAIEMESFSKLDASSIGEYATDGVKELKNWLYMYLACMAFPITLSMLPRIRNAYGKRHERVTHDDKARSEE